LKSKTNHKSKHDLMREMFAQISGHRIIRQRKTFWIKGDKTRGMPDRKVVQYIDVTEPGNVKAGTHHERKRKAWALARILYKQQRAERKAEGVQ